MRVAKRKNLLKLRSLITIPHKKKDKLFTEMMRGFVRYKEPLRVKNTIISICKNKGDITAKDLAKSMNYKNISNSYKWLNHHVKNGLLLRIQKYHCKVGYNGPVLTRYTLNKP